MLPTDADFNANTRTILFKLDIFLNGPSSAPLSITRNNYLISFNYLEEATSGDTPFDNVSSNELSITLYSPNGIFNPTNTNSPYYGKMKRNVCIKPYVRTNEMQDWKQVGELYVTDWTSALTSDVATIIADDIMYDIFGRDSVDFAVQHNLALSTFITGFFNVFDITPTIPATLTNTLPMAYITQENKDFLTQLATAFKLLYNVAHNGTITVRELSTPQVLRATLTDSNQILTLDAKLSINSDYDAANLIYYIPTESGDTDILKISKITLSSGNTDGVYVLDKIPLIRFKYLSLIGDDALCSVVSATCTSKTLQCKLNNPDDETAITNLTLNGTYIETIAHSLGTQGQNTLKVDNPYIQTSAYAQQYMQFLQRFIASNVPVITAHIRGNPLLEIGDKIRLISVRDNVDFTGILLRQNYKYDGGLVSDITVLNATLVEEVT